MKRIYTYSLPSNGSELLINGSHVIDAYSTPSGIEVSVEAIDGAGAAQTALMVVTTGYGYEDKWTAVKTVVSPEGYSWHVLARNVEAERLSFLSRKT